MQREALLETVKSFLRGVYFVVLGMLVTFLYSLATSTDLINQVISIGDVYLPVGTVIVFVISAVAKLIDRYVHTNQGIEAKGIAPKFLQGE